MKKPGQKFNYEIEPTGIDYRIVRVGGPAGRLAIFRASNHAKAKAWLQIYLMLSIPDRRKLRSACA